MQENAGKPDDDERPTAIFSGRMHIHGSRWSYRMERTIQNISNMMKYNGYYITKNRGDDMRREAVQRQRSGKKKKQGTYAWT
jgi:hypothetical protein